MTLDISSVRRQFPVLRRSINGRPLVYLDSAATAQMPEAVCLAMARWNKEQKSNVHRGMHVLAEESTVAYEDARTAVQKFLNAAHPDEIIFTKGCTESINLVARSWGETHLQEGDAVVLSMLEHHSNVVPWLQLKDRKGSDVLWMDIDEDGMPKLDDLKKHLKTGRVKLVAITALSNVLGIAPDLKTIIAMAHDAGAWVLIDAAQAIAHMPIDVQDLDCDFLAFSGHKLYGPTGIGVLYGKRKLLEKMPPFLGGGMMIHSVTQEGFTPADLPGKFEAGTPPIAEAVGLAAAIEWMQQYSWEDIQAHEQELLRFAIDNLRLIPQLHVLGTDGKSQIINHKSPIVYGCLSFTLDSVHPHDLTEILGRQGIALRAGHHCCMPLHTKLGIPASTRLSVGIYNMKEEIDVCAQAIVDAQKKLHT